MKELDEILSGKEPEQETQPVASSGPATEQPAEAEKPEQPRAPDGKFASKEPKEPEAEAEAPPPAEPEPKKGTVPQQAVHAERQKRRELEDENAAMRRELAELRGKVDGIAQMRQPQPAPEAEKPDFWAAPDKFVESALTPVQEAQMRDRFALSYDLATLKYGDDVVEQALEGLKAAVAAGELDDKAVQAKLKSSANPFRDIVQWYKSSPAVREAELRAQIEAEIREKVLTELGQQPNPAPQPEAQPQVPNVMPSNLSGVRNVGTRSGPAWSGPASLNDIFDRKRQKTA